jgi:hypothetical protein
MSIRTLMGLIAVAAVELTLLRPLFVIVLIGLAMIWAGGRIEERLRAAGKQARVSEYAKITHS